MRELNAARIWLQHSTAAADADAVCTCDGERVGRA